MKRDKEKYKSYIYFIAFGVAAVSRMLEASALIEFSQYFFGILSIISAILFFFKFLLDKHSAKENIMVSFVSVLLILAYLRGLPHYVVVAFLGFVSIKGVDIRQLIKLDLTIKCIFIFSHLFLFGLNSALEPISAEAAFYESSKGISNALYFKNPNTTGIIGIWAVIEYLYLSKSKKVKKYIFSTLCAILVFAITYSRSAIFVFVVYMILHLFNEKRVLTVISKVMYPLLFFATLYIIMNVVINSQALVDLNKLLSGRISQSISIYNVMGINFFPTPTPDGYFDYHVVDNFYVRCITYYGIVTAVMYYLPYLFIKRKTDKETKIMSIISAIYLFMEASTMNIGLCPPYLIMADSIYNKNEKKDEKNK